MANNIGWLLNYSCKLWQHVDNWLKIRFPRFFTHINLNGMNLIGFTRIYVCNPIYNFCVKYSNLCWINWS